jgi:hypothetical protein
MPNWTFFSEVPAARGPSFDDSEETEQSNWLEERSNPSLWQAGSRGLSDRHGLPLRRVLQEKGTMSGTRTGFHQGSRQHEQNQSLAASGREAPR